MTGIRSLVSTQVRGMHRFLWFHKQTTNLNEERPLTVAVE